MDRCPQCRQRLVVDLVCHVQVCTNCNFFFDYIKRNWRIELNTHSILLSDDQNSETVVIIKGSRVVLKHEYTKESDISELSATLNSNSDTIEQLISFK